MKIHPLSLPSSSSSSLESLVAAALLSSPKSCKQGSFPRNDPMIQRPDPAKKAIPMCANQGCSREATAIVTSEWLPDDEWKVCETCQWTLDPNSCAHHHQLFILPMDERVEKPRELTGVLQETTSLNQANLPVKMPLGEGKAISVVDSGAAKYDASFPAFVKVLSLQKLNATRRIQNCNHCPLQACALWKDVSRKQDFVCIDCQEATFGGWPAPKDLLGKAYMNDAQIEAMIQKCSTRKDPCMPPPYFKP